jgi:wyosine [tRNA(Phe)-imidazoG37] synthetase (radical SAM superfamily)
VMGSRSVVVKKAESYALKFCSLCSHIYTLECTSFNDTSYCSDLCFYCVYGRFYATQRRWNSTPFVLTPEIREHIREISKQDRDRKKRFVSTSDSDSLLPPELRHYPIEKMRADLIMTMKLKYGF